MSNSGNRRVVHELVVAVLTVVALLLIWLSTGVATGYSDEEPRAYLFLKKYPTFQIRFPNPDDSESDYLPFPELHPEERDAITALCKYRYGMVSTEVAKIEECRQKPNRGAR